MTYHRPPAHEHGHGRRALLDRARTCTLSLATAASLAMSALAGAAPDPDALLTFTQRHPMLPPTDDTPMVQVFADGRVLVSRDSLRRNPGEFTYALEPGELDRLLGLAGIGLDGLNDIVTTSAAEAAVPAPGPVPGATVSLVSDPTTSLIGIDSTLGRSGAVPAPAPGDDAATISAAAGESGRIVVALVQTPESLGSDASVAAVPAAPQGADPGTVTLQLDDVAEAEPLRTLEDALLALYLLPDDGQDASGAQGR